MNPHNDTPPRLCPNAEARLGWLALHLTKIEGRVVGKDEVVDRAISLLADRVAGEALARLFSPTEGHSTSLVHTFAAPLLDLLIPQGTA